MTLFILVFYTSVALWGMIMGPYMGFLKSTNVRFFKEAPPTTLNAFRTMFWLFWGITVPMIFSLVILKVLKIIGMKLWGFIKRNPITLIYHSIVETVQYILYYRRYHKMRKQFVIKKKEFKKET